MDHKLPTRARANPLDRGSPPVLHCTKRLVPLGTGTREGSDAMKDHERRIRYWRPGVLTALPAVAAALLLDSGAQAGLKFPPAQTLSSGQNASGATVAVDSQDRATVAWWRLDGANQMIESVRLGADGVPGEVNILLSNAGDRFIGPQVAVDPQGSATVVWERDTDVFGDSGCSAGSFPTCVQAIRV